MDILRCENTERRDVPQHPEREDQNHAHQPRRPGQVHRAQPREDENADIFMYKHYERRDAQYEQQHIMRKRFCKAAMKDIHQCPARAAARTVQPREGIERAAERGSEANAQIHSGSNDRSGEHDCSNAPQELIFLHHVKQEPVQSSSSSLSSLSSLPLPMTSRKTI